MASEHNITKPYGLGDTVNDAVVQGKFTFLSGEICPFDSLERDGSLTVACFPQGGLAGNGQEATEP